MYKLPKLTGSVAATIMAAFSLTAMAENTTNGVSVAAVQAVVSPGRTTAEILAKAPTFQLILDASGSSPATEKASLASYWPAIEQKMRAMPLGSKVIVQTFGDTSARPLSIEVRVQTKKTPTGDTIDGLVRDIKGFVLSFPDNISPQPTTHAVGAFFDASKNVNPDAVGNTIVMVSDLIENSPFGNCYTDLKCRLPEKPPFTLQQVDVLVLGVGRGRSSKEEIAIHQSWASFLQKAGARAVLKRV